MTCRSPEIISEDRVAWGVVVLLHFLSAAILVLSTSFRELPGWSWLGCGLGAALHLWAMRTMTILKVRMRPEPDAGARLVTTGPYRFLRHPMYAALLLATGSLLPAPWRIWRILVWLLLLIILVVKSRREERLLTQAFPEYPDAMRRAWRLVPWLY